MPHMDSRTTGEVIESVERVLRFYGRGLEKCDEGAIAEQISYYESGIRRSKETLEELKKGGEHDLPPEETD